ncbi:hypothetical protein GCM10011581_05750 [Saccharopolyspora subtropica]|uniref:HEPN domain-containing protein n=1 Tax=Saccharopolyspora thermophila TaxID=89367 RepID=A0A917JJK9_9PSEU|nr:hypothetical protein [Saccharopolyspora subtropica]GGI71594.1 hypothetical protein GCM10011581_05750 [Saccharopolyspora subtropica]
MITAMVLHVGKKPLRSRRDQLRASADRVHGTRDAATVCLLLFYAAECGLKERLLDRGGHSDTSALENTHDLRKLAKDLRLPRMVSKHLERLQRCRLHRSRRNTVDVAELHQAWRYGAKLDAADEKEADAALRALISWCEQD